MSTGAQGYPRHLSLPQHCQHLPIETHLSTVCFPPPPREGNLPRTWERQKFSSSERAGVRFIWEASHQHLHADVQLRFFPETPRAVSPVNRE